MDQCRIRILVKILKYLLVLIFISYEIDCSKPPAVSSGIFSPDETTYPFGTNISYTCDLGYNVTSGDATRACAFNDTWSGTEPTCSVSACLKPTALPHSSISPDTATYAFSSTLTYTCTTGYERTSGEATLTCETTGLWSGTPPSCTLVTCTAPAAVNHATGTPIQDVYNYNTKISYTCVLAYSLTSGNSQRTCDATGAWTGSAPICTVSACLAPAAVTFSTVTAHSSTSSFGDTLTYACDLSYDHTSGELTRTCQNTGDWTGSAPVCTIANCLQPSAVTNATLSPVQILYEFDDTVKYSCDTGYYHYNSGDITVTCLITGLWQGTIPTCSLVRCDKPATVADSTHIPVRDKYDYNNGITYTCNLSFNLTSGNLVRTCQHDFSWSVTAPVCTVAACLQPSTVSNASPSPDTPTYEFREHVTYTCTHGYYHNTGELVRTCLPTGGWTDTAPTCPIVTCAAPTSVDHAPYTPFGVTHEFSTSITYTCNLGYEHTSGDLVRTCQHTFNWDNSPPVCTIKTCPFPGNNSDMSYSPILVIEHDWNTWINYTCNIGYEYASGDMSRRCQDSKTWSGSTPVCEIVKCPPTTVSHMTYSPAVIEYNTEITYVCDVGYNHSIGNLQRLCLPTAQFDGDLPGCTIVLCDPPVVAVPHAATYTPFLTEHEYNTIVTYECDEMYHYVSGGYSMTCNETGTWPGVNLDCTTLHTLSLASLQPVLTQLLIPATSVTITFDFDGICDVTMAVVPPLLTAGKSLSASSITMTLTTNAGILPGMYTLTLSPFRDSRTWTAVSTTVFYGEHVAGISARLVKDVNIVHVGEVAVFETTLTAGTDVDLLVTVEPGHTLNQTISDHFITTNRTYTYASPDVYTVIIETRNFVSTISTAVVVEVIYPLNNLDFIVDNNPASTTVAAVFSLEIATLANLPMGTMDISVDYNHGVGETSTETPSVPISYTFNHLYPVQGEYTVTLNVTTALEHQTFSLNLSVWDSLDALQLVLLYDTDGYYITNETTVLGFNNAPNAGFEYSINFGDGTQYASTDPAVLYQDYNLGSFNTTYNVANTYTVTWSATNGGYSKSGSVSIIVQNALPTDSSLYTLEPVQLKFPWSTVQVVDISVNFTLQPTADIATDATCNFDGGDGSNIVSNITFDDFMEVDHGFIQEGTIVSRFHCANLVSAETFEYTNTIVKFQASDITIEYSPIVPMNKSDSINVYFHVKNNGFALLPLNVTLEWDFGDGNGVTVYPYDGDTIDYSYVYKGDYKVTLTVDVPESSTSQTHSLPLRLGLMYVETNYYIAYTNRTELNYRMWGAFGDDVTYTVEFFDGTLPGSCHATDDNGCTVSHFFPIHGYFDIILTVQNATYNEFDGFQMTIDSPIENITVDIPDEIEIPPGVVTVQLHILEDALSLPDLNCTFDFADAIKREYVWHQQNVLYTQSFFYQFQYISLGRREIGITCRNLINETHYTHWIKVTNEDFDYTGTFDRYYSQQDSPMLVSTMVDNILFSRLGIEAPYDLKTPQFEWMVEDTLGSVPVFIPDGTTVMFPRGTVQDATYNVTLVVSFIEQPENAVFEPTFIRFISPSPFPYIVDGSRRYANPGIIEVNSGSSSFDPVYPDASTGLTFLWICKRYTSSSFNDAESQHESGSGTACSLTDIGYGKVQLDSNTSPSTYWYSITVTVTTSRGSSSEFTQYINIRANSGFSIRCLVNCMSKVVVSSKLVLMADMPDNCLATYTWHLYRIPDTGADLLTTPKSLTGYNKKTLSINGNTLESGFKYRAQLSIVKDGVSHQALYYEFVTNKKPEQGTCEVFPNEQEDKTFAPTGNDAVEAITAGLNLTCQGWQDEGFGTTMSTLEPLTFFFFLQYGNRGDLQKQILYYDSGATAPIISLRVGDPHDNYNAVIKLQVVDIYGDYAELTYDVPSTPGFTNADINNLDSSAMFTAVTNYISVHLEYIKQANRTKDFRTLATKVEALASIYTRLEVRKETRQITLEPEDLSALGSKTTANGTQVGWSDYWSLITENLDTSTEDYLVALSQNLTEMLLYQIDTWPVGERMNIYIIEHITQALNSTLSNINYLNTEAAIAASKVLKRLSVELETLMQQTITPSTERLDHANTALIDTIANILEFLQTVLTPNLPHDPTVDEMRKYLEYIRIFKTAEDILLDPLTLQEQTFVAQKQLQKFALEKEIKSIASQEAVPDIEETLRIVGYVLMRMINTGHPYMQLNNDYLHISLEVRPFYDWSGTSLLRPRVSIDLTTISEVAPQSCSDSKVTIQTIVFRENPYFWSQYGDRITSFVPSIKMDGALLGSNIYIHLENKVVPECIDATPQYDDDNVDKLIYVLFDRRFADDDILLFIRPNTTSVVYELYFQLDEKPIMTDSSFLYTTTMQLEHHSADDGYKLLIPAENLPVTGKIWIAFKPILADGIDESTKEQVLLEKFCTNVTTVNCLVWSHTELSWDKQRCRVDASSSRKETTCICDSKPGDSTLTVGTTFYVPPNMIDFKKIMISFEMTGNVPVLAAIVSVLVIYLLITPLIWREDEKDKYRWELALLVDNDIADDYFYLIKVYTGVRTGAGTRSKVGFVLVGENNDTGCRILDDDTHMGFEGGTIRTFVLGSRMDLGELLCMRIWHDDSGGSRAAWFLNKIVVTDLQTGRKYFLQCDEWLANSVGQMRCDKVLKVSPSDKPWTLKESASYITVENHLWISIFIRPFPSVFSRIERLSSVLLTLYFCMIVSVVYLSVEGISSDGAKVGPFVFSLDILLLAMKSSVIAYVPSFIITFLFKYSRTASVKNQSYARRLYRVINDTFLHDNNVLGTDYVSPASDAVAPLHYILPRFCVYLAWGLLWSCIGVSSYFCLADSFDWPATKSEMWVSVIVCCAVTIVVLVEGVKVLGLIFLISGLCRMGYDPPDPPIDVQHLREIAKRNSRFMTQGPQYAMYLDHPKLQEEDDLETNRRRRSSEEEFFKVIYQLMFYAFVLFVVTFISYETRDPLSFYYTNHMKNQFNFDKVTDAESYIAWMKGTFTDAYFSEQYFGAQLEGTSLKQYTKDLASIRVGPARLRQVRTQTEACLGPLGVGQTCYNKFNSLKQDKDSYCLGWAPQPCKLAEKSSTFSSPAWKYVSSDDIWGFPTEATYNTYSGGGYFMKLDVNKDVCLQIYDELFIEYQWYDRQTRAIILEFALYTANANLFTYLQFVAEFPEVGGVIPSTHVAAFRLFSSDLAYLVSLCEFFFLVFVFLGSGSILYAICSSGTSFFKSAWNIMDIIAMLASYVTVGVFIYKLILVERSLAVFREDKNAYVGFENLAFYDFIVTVSHGILVFILSIRISRALGFSEKIHEMAAVISTASSDLAGFCLIFLITYVAYVMMGTLLFGKDTAKYRDPFQTYGTLTEAIIGKNRLNAILTSNPGLAEFYYFTFVLFVLMTLTTMAAAILNFSISHVKEEMSKNEEFQSIVGMVKLKMISLMKVVGLDRLIASKENKGSNGGTKKRRTSDSDVNDVISDLRYFFTEFRSKKKDKYRKMDNE